MKHKYLMVALSAVMLSGGIGAVSTSSASAAVHSINSSFWNKTRKVKVTKKTTFRRFDALRRRYVKGHKTFKKGKVIKVRAAGEFKGWVLPAKAGSRYWYVSEKKSSNWMKEYHKRHTVSEYTDDYHDPHWSGNTYTVDDGSKITVNGLTKINRNLGFTNAGYLLLNITLKYNSTTPRVADNYFNKNFYLYPAGKSYNDYQSGDRTIIAADLEKAPQYQDAIKAGGKTISYGQTRTFIVPFSLDDAFVNASSFTIEDLYGQKKTFTSESVNI